MKKKLFAYILMMLPALLMTSCLKDQDDKFSESASERAANYLSKTKEVLTSSEQGWVLNYFPDRKQSYGGYSYTLKFDDQNVTACWELSEDERESITTTYTLDNEDGPSISFDTYNDFLHYFATPHGSSGAGGYQAYDGDFIFIIMDISEDQNTITLKGNRSGNIMYMHRLDESIEDYQTALREFTDNLVFNTAVCDLNGEEYTMSLLIDDRYINIEDSEGGTIEAPFCFDKDGFTLYEPITIGNSEVKSFKYDEEEGTFTAVEDNSVVFTGLLIPSIVIDKVGEDIVIGNPAKTLEYTFNLADKFTYTSNDDWITVSVDGKNLTINVAQNTTGDERTGTITVEANGQLATITISQVPLNKMFVGSEAYVAYSNISDAAKPYFLACKTLSDSESENIGQMVFANVGAPYGYGIFFTSGNYSGLMGLDTEFIDDNKIKFTYNGSRNYSSGNWYYNKGYKTLITYLASTTFTVTADSEEEPTYFILTDTNDSSKYFKLVLKAVSNPFAN